jgi:hypothetical protein
LRVPSSRWPPIPATLALRREQIRLQVALITPLPHIKGYAAPESKAAAEQARLLIEKAEALGESPSDPLLVFSVRFAIWSASYIAFIGDEMRELAVQVPGACREGGDPSPANDRAWRYGHFFDAYGRYRDRTSTSRSRYRALRSCPASSAGDALAWTPGLHS